MENDKRINFVLSSKEFDKLERVRERLGTRTYTEAIRVLINKGAVE